MNTITAAATTYTPPSTSVIHNAQVSLTDRSPASVVHVVQYDDTLPIVAVALTANGQAYTVPAGAAVNVRMRKPDGTYVYNPALGVSENAQTAYIAVTLQMDAAWGRASPIIEIVVDGNVAATGTFTMIIDENPVPESAIESTSEFLTIQQLAAQVQQAADLVQEQATNLQNVTDNLEAIQNAAANAQAAAASAAAAQQAAQEALGFRTFFSAVTPDENGDLDPSRPMTTPTAASVTVKSKGDRIQSVQVNGFTTQAGTGDPSPTNVRAITVGGLRMVEVVFDGSADENWRKSTGVSGNAYYIPVSNALMKGIVFASYAAFVENSVLFSLTRWAVSNGGSYNYIRLSAPLSDLVSFKQYLQSNPITVWYTPVDVSQSPGLYIPKIAQGHEYRCQMMKLTAPLCDGDKVESCVPSGCDKTITIDGSTVAVTASGSNYVVTAADAAAGGNAYTEDLAYLSLTAGQIAIPAASFPASVTGAQTANAWLQSNPQKVWYQSSAYTEAADLPVQLETHSFGVYAMTGAEDIKREGSSAGQVYFGLPSKNAANQSTSIICSQAKGGPSIKEGNIQIASNIVYVWFSGYGFDKTVDELKEYIAAQHSAGTPVTIVYKLATPAIYARDPVTLVAVPFTEADETAANQLANTPSTLPAIDSPDVPMLLDETGDAEPTAQIMALAANAVPVAGTYVVSSQDGTTVAVSLKAMQDGGDAATVGGLTPDQVVTSGPKATSSTAGVVTVSDTPDGSKTAAGGWAASPAAVQAVSADIYMIRAYAQYTASNPRLLVAAINLPSGINAGINQFAVSVEVENEADAAYQHFVKIASNRASVYFRKPDGSAFQDGNVVWFNALIIVNR